MMSDPCKIVINGVGDQELIIPSAQLQKVPPLIFAVRICNAWKSYGQKSSVINNLNMTVPRGTIYGLLGSSGCGKTTVLSCIVGTRKMDKGFVSVFGQTPGSPESEIPGRTVGYMPQELALYDNLTIGETFEYFGRLYGMTYSEINSKMESMFTFLDLPDKSRLIGSLSGGQQRRTSLGVSIIHEPPLLILDEPTVGVDPLLRERIWDYLDKLVANRGTTVLITTHYIEEAKNAHAVGVMRNGRLLEEASPTFLLKQYGTHCLEDLVLNLCKLDSVVKKGHSETKPHGSATDLRFQRSVYCSETSENIDANVSTRKCILPFNHSDSMDLITRKSSGNDGCSFSGKFFIQKLNRVRAISYKNLSVVARQKLLLVILVLLPPINLFVTVFVAGGEPKGMNIGVINPETNYSLDVCKKAWKGSNDDAGTLENFSCHLLNALPAGVLAMHPTLSYDEALLDVQLGRTMGFLEFPQDYSKHSIARVIERNFASNATLVGSTVSIRMDITNFLASYNVRRTLLLGLQRFAKTILAENGEEARKAELPLKFSAVYGNEDDLDIGIGEYLAAATLIAVVFYFPSIPVGITCIADHKIGTFERARIAGATIDELILGYLVTNFLFVLLVTGTGYIVLVYGIQVKILGSMYLWFTLCIVTGICGGFFIIFLSEIVTEELEGILVGTACFSMSLMLCGAGWPIEAFPQFLMFFTYYCIPYTWTIRSLRSISTRDWGISHPKVWPGLAIPLTWIGIFCILTFLARRRQR